MAQTTIEGDLKVTQNISSASLTVPAGAVTNDGVSATADIAATKLEHQYQHVYTQGHTVTAAADRKVIHVVRGATGTLVSLYAGITQVSVGNATITVDLKKNGTTVLSATISITSSHTAFQNVAAGAFSSASLVQGDVLELDITVNAGSGTLGKGLWAVLVEREKAS